VNQWLDDMVSDVSAAHEPAGAFGSPPKPALLMPTIVIFAFSGIVLGGVLPRTPALAFIVLYIAFVIGTLVELSRSGCDHAASAHASAAHAEKQSDHRPRRGGARAGAPYLRDQANNTCSWSLTSFSYYPIRVP
jgi:hypothetical protein